MNQTPQEEPPKDPEFISLTEDELKELRVNELSLAIEDRDKSEVLSQFEAMHPADAADAIELLPRPAITNLVELIGEDFPAGILIEMRDEYRELAVDSLSDAAVSEALNTLDTDDAAVILDDMDEARQSDVLESLPAADRAELQRALAFDDETVGRLMQRDFLAAPEFWTIGQTVDHARGHSEDLPETFFEIYVIDPAFRVVGAVPLHLLLRTPRAERLSDIMKDIEVEIGPDMDQEEVAYLFQKYDLTSAPVVDESGRLTGMVTIDDIVDVIQEENREDLLALSGVSSASAFDTVLASVRSRAPWLAINVATAFIASAVISLFRETIDQFVALAILMPVIVALGGNAGSQTLAVSVRGLAERELSGAAARRAVLREAITALINGVIFAVAVAAVTYVWFQDPRLSVVIAVAMLATFLWAGISGILIPLTLEKLGADPAVASSVFLLTTVDIIGFLSFLGLASLVLL